MGLENVFQNIIPISGIISAMVLPLIPLLLVPVIDYSVSQPQQVNTSRIFTSFVSITNVGSFPTKNVTVSIIADKVSITDISAEPYLPKKTKSFNSDSLNYPGRGLFQADKLLPHATMLLQITMNVPLALDSQKLVVYVQSDETVGYHGVRYVILAYVAVSLTLAFIAMYYLAGPKGGLKDKRILIPAGLCIAALAILFVIVQFT